MSDGIVLGMDTATPATAVAVLRPGGEGVERRDDPEPGARPRHAERLLPLAAEVLAAAGATWADVATLAVGVGPGGFTGLRIGVATARGLAQGRGMALVGVSTLAALARAATTLAPRAHQPGGTGSSAGPAGAEVVLAVLDARRGEVYAAVYDRVAPTAPLAGGEQPTDARTERGTCLLEPRALAPDALAAAIAERGWAGAPAVGDGAVRFRAVFDAAGVRVPADDSPAHRVSALAICALAVAGPPGPTVRDDLLPDYRREPDAVPPKRP